MMNDYELAIENPAPYAKDNGRNQIDTWLEVCGRCPLPDCIRPEGHMLLSVKNKAYLQPCPAQRAYEAGYGPDYVLKNGSEFGLLEDDFF